MSGSLRRAVAFLFLWLAVAALAAGPDVLSEPDKETPRHQGSELKSSIGRDAGAPELVRLVSATDRGLVFELEFEEFDLVNRAGGVAVRVGGLERLAVPGEPDLPSSIVLVGIPQHGNVTLSVVADEPEVLSDVNLAPAVGYGESVRETPRHQEHQGSGLEAHRGQEPGRADAYGRDAFWPGPLAELAGIEVLRGLRVARIRVNPVQYNPVQQKLRVHKRVRVSVGFEKEGSKVRGSQGSRPDPLDPVFERMLINGSQALGWKLDPGRDDDTVSFFSRSGVWCKVKTDTTGVYKIASADLAAAGFSTDGIDPRTFRLYSLGPHAVNGYYPDTMVEMPVFVTGEDDGRLDRNDYLAFYALAPSHWNDDQSEWEANFFTCYQCFWLTWGGEPGRRMDVLSGAGPVSPQSSARRRMRVEEDRLCPARSGLLWLWERYYKQAGLAASTHELVLELPNREVLDELKLRFYGRTGINRVRVYLNGAELDTFRFSGAKQGPPPADILFDSIPAEAAGTGPADTLVFEFFGDEEMEVYLDFIEAGYQERLAVSAAEPWLEFCSRNTGSLDFGIEGAQAGALVLDLTDPWAPRRIVDGEVSGGRLNLRAEVSGQTVLGCALSSHLRAPVFLEQRSPGRLRSAAEQADYYIVCPDEFHAAGRMLAEYRDGNVAGIPDARARAVRLSNVYDEFSFGLEEPGAIRSFFRAKRPAYGLLAGDATYDYRNNFDVERPPSVPAYEVGFDIDPEVYGGIAKAYDAWYADFDTSGRGPDMILARVTCRSATELRVFLEKVRKYESQPLGYWAKRFLLLGDDEWEGDPSEPDFIGFDHIRGCEGMVPYGRGLLDPVKIYLTEYPFTGVNDKAAARQELLNRLYQGALFWCFFGHGAGFQLCHERALHIDGVPQVESEARNPIAFFGSCGVGRFEDTRYEAVAEELVRKPSACIATLGASKATTPGGNEYFAHLLYGTLMENPEEPIGPAFYEAWVNANLYYHLFGDPATVLRIPRPGIEPVIAPDTFYPGARVVVSDSVAFPAGMYGYSAYEADWFRSYYSEHPQSPTTYYLSGYEVGKGIGTFDSSVVQSSFTVPRIDYPDTLIVGDGSYVRVPGSCWVSLLCWDGEAGHSSRRSGIPLGDPVETEDTMPPELTLYADRWLLSSTDTVAVPRSFVLTGVLSDESGILLAPVPGYGLGLYIGARTTGRIDLMTRFSYDENSATTGRFTYPVDIGNEVDSITVIASDNMQNRLTKACYVKTRPSDVLRLDSCLVYPNPVGGPARFTFVLSRAAFVSVRVYTISGRLVRRLPEQPCTFGYNQIEWDGRDENGVLPANGVYLYKLDAKTSDNLGGFAQSTTAYRDKFLVLR